MWQWPLLYLLRPLRTLRSCFLSFTQILVDSNRFPHPATGLHPVYSTPVFSFSYAIPVRIKGQILSILVLLLDLTKCEIYASICREFPTPFLPRRSATFLFVASSFLLCLRLFALPLAAPLFSITSNNQISQPLSFDNHTKCPRGVYPPRPRPLKLCFNFGWHKSFRMRTSKTLLRNSFRMRSYKNTLL